MKVCTICGFEKDSLCFSRHKKNNDGLQGQCKKCQAEVSKAHYHANKEKIIARTMARQAEQTKVNREYISEFLSQHPCVDCGISDPIVLDFDHIRGEKKNSVSDLASHGYSLQTVIDEIEKCEVRCANCHRRRHYFERNMVPIV